MSCARLARCTQSAILHEYHAILPHATAAAKIYNAAWQESGGSGVQPRIPEEPHTAAVTVAAAVQERRGAGGCILL